VPDEVDRAFLVPPQPVGMTDASLPQSEMRAEPALAMPVKLIFADLLQAATDGSLRWERMREGIEIARLYATPDGGPSAALLRYTPGARLQRHEHTGFEHIFVLAGSQVDDSGEHHAGALLIHGPGTSHTISSKHGCVVLAVWERPVRFLG
jgi:anti-sigma factor ChrR (cupin superfamily)